MIRYNPKGLTTPQIDESRRRHGDNVITPPKDDSEIGRASCRERV